jgi:hypothetical protein
MKIHAHALAFVDAYAAAGCPLAASAAGVGPSRDSSPAALDDALRAFLGPGQLWAGSAPRRALRAVVQAQGRGARELLTWPVALARLPEPYTIELARKSDGALVTTHGATWYANVDRVPCFVARELDAIAGVFACGRATPRELDAWIAQKRRSPRWVLAPDPIAARTGITPDPDLTFGELFDALGAELVRVTVAGREAKAA